MAFDIYINNKNEQKCITLTQGIRKNKPKKKQKEVIIKRKADTNDLEKRKK